jgi:hypothetical protein
VKHLVVATILAASLNFAAAQNPPALTDENSSLYLGYYLEDAINNPEDPTPGALLLRLPKTDAAFAGALYFTFVGCQTESWGEIEGRLERGTLRGNWSGAVDGSPQRGSFSGELDPQTGMFSGVFDNSQGKQFREIPDCISYHIAARGTWEMFTPENLQEGDVALSTRWPFVEWRAPSPDSILLLYVLDQSLLGSAEPHRAVVAQVIAMPGENRQRLPASKLRSGREYLIVGMAFDAQMKPIGRGSVKVTRQ